MPILDPNVVEFVSGSPAQTARLGERLGKLLRGGEVICLEGNLGAGKTCLAQGIGRGWGAATDLTSPTFTLIHEYGDGPRVYHIDLYRLRKLREAASLGLEELLDREAVVLVEWGERFPELWPAERIEIRLSTLDEDAREIRILT